MDKELKFQQQSLPRQTDSTIKKRKRSEVQILQWETIRRQSTIIEDKELNINGMVRLTLSEDTQKALECLIGHQVSSESPWTSVKKESLTAHLAKHQNHSEIFQFKDSIAAYKDKELLIGYIFTAEKPNQFYICLTEAAKEDVLELIETNKLQRDMRVQSCINREVKKWTSLGSEIEVDDNKPCNGRQLLVIQTVAGITGLHKAAEFQDRDPDDVRDGYVHFKPNREKYDTVAKRRVDSAIQATPETDTSVAQTVPPLPSNVWTQYEYHVDTQKEISGDLACQMVQFVHHSSPQMTDLVRYNGVFDLYKDDYPKLVKSRTDTQIPHKMTYEQFLSFMDVKICKGKRITAAAWHPMFTGLVACAYADNLNSSENEVDHVLHDVFCDSQVLVWSFEDRLNPKLILGCPHEVYSLQFCPVNENILVGGCINGQIVVWDISGKLKNFENEPKLSPKKLKYHLALHSLLGWMKSRNKSTYLSPVLVSSFEHSASSCITDIKWLSPYYKMTHLGRYHDLKPASVYSLQFVSCSLDGSLLIWDLQSSSRVKYGGKRPNQKRKFPVFKPLYKLVAENAVSGGYVPLTTVMVEPFPQNYTLQEPVSSKRKFSLTQQFTYKPEFHKPKAYPEMKIYLGSLEGEIIEAKWEGYEFNPGVTVNKERMKYHSWCQEHDGQVSSISMSPFNENLFLTIGGRVIAIWRANMKEKPLLWRQSKVKLTDGTWSLFSPSIFYVTRIDGSFEVWDFLNRSDKPSLIQSITGGILTGIYPSKLGVNQNLIGISDNSGIFHVFFVPSEHMKDSQKCKKAVTSFFSHEMECRHFVEECQKSWLESNAEILAAQKEAAKAEAKMRETEKRARERAEREKRKKEDEKLGKKKLEKIKDFMKDEIANKKWHAEQDQLLTYVLLGKKQLNEPELLEKKFPLDRLKEDERRKKTKQRRQPYHGIVREPPEAAAKVAKEYKEVDTIVEKYFKEFKEREETFLNYKQENPYQYSVSWKQLLAEGMQRYQVVNTALHSDLSRLERYFQTKYDHKEVTRKKYEMKGREKKNESGNKKA